MLVTPWGKSRAVDEWVMREREKGKLSALRSLHENEANRFAYLAPASLGGAGAGSQEVGRTGGDSESTVSFISV